MKNTKILIGAVLILLSIHAASAEFWACFNEGDHINFCGSVPDRTAPNDNYKLCMDDFDNQNNCWINGNYLACLHLPPVCSDVGGNTTLDTEPPTLQISSPINGSLFTSKNVLLDLTASETVDIKFQKQSNPGKWTSICSDCVQYSQEKNFDEGPNEITFRITDRAGNEVYYAVFFNIDSKDPKIKSLTPDSGFASGIFELDFEEENPESLVIHYGNQNKGFRDYAVNLASDCSQISGGKYHCISNINLEDYDGQQIGVYASLSDVAGNLAETQNKQLDVDYSDPIFSSADYSVIGKKVTFTLELIEPYLKEITYKDTTENNPQEKTLCSSLVNDICEKQLSFNDEGYHEIIITARDEAGNEATRLFSFYTDSKQPKITSISPIKGFASGLFEIEFEEENVDFISLYYGNEETGVREYKFHSDLCTSTEKGYYCPVELDLSDYDGQQIDYEFTVVDKVGQIVAKGWKNLAVDMSYPIIDSLDYEIDGKYVYITIEVTEPYLNEIIYIDNSEINPKEKRLCSSLKNGLCEKKLSFTKDGNHDLTISVKDEAGHVTAQDIQFFTDAKEPKIKSTEPSMGFASGLFEIEFEESNPISVVLTYGNEQNGQKQTSLSLSEDCSLTNSKYYCSDNLDLSDYDGQKINYEFTVTDKADQKDSDGASDLNVDFTFPKVYLTSYNVNGKRAEITLGVTESNLDKISYINLDDPRPREKTFCTKLKDETCTKKIPLNAGENRISFQISDKAGNSIAQSMTISA